jgi:hypothetical protein
MGPIYTHTKKLEITWNKAALPNNAKWKETLWVLTYNDKCMQEHIIYDL